MRHNKPGAKYCGDCGEVNTDPHAKMQNPPEGVGEHLSICGGGHFRTPRFCEECGSPYPWTQAMLNAAKDYVDGMQQLSHADRAELKDTFDHLTKDTIHTPVAADRLGKLMEKMSPAVGTIVLKFVEAFASAAAKSMIGS